MSGSLLVSLLFVFFGDTTSAPSRDRPIAQFHHTAWTAKDGAPSSAWGGNGILLASRLPMR